PRLVGTGPVDRTRVAVRADRSGHLRHRIVGVSREIAVLEHDVPGLIGVRADEAPAVVVHRLAELSAARAGLELAVRAEPEVAAVDDDLGAVLEADLSAVGAAGRVEPVVEAPLRIVGEALDVLAAEAGEEDVALAVL